MRSVCAKFDGFFKILIKFLISMSVFPFKMFKTFKSVIKCLAQLFSCNVCVFLISFIKFLHYRNDGKPKYTKLITQFFSTKQHLDWFSFQTLFWNVTRTGFEQ